MSDSELNLNKILDEVKIIASDTASYIRSQVGKVAEPDIEEKELNSLVSFVDKEAEKMLVSSLNALLPNSGFITEEDTVVNRKEDYTWIIDPLDGTTNFLFQVPYFSVSIALMHQDEIILGIVHEVSRDEQFYALKGQGAYLNGNPIQVSQRKSSMEVLIATGFPYSKEEVAPLIETLKNFIAVTRGVRRLGSAATDLCYVAAGRLGGYYETTLNSWDVAAGALIVMEAGGRVSDFRGGTNYIFGGEILACGSKYFDAFLDCLEPIKK